MRSIAHGFSHEQDSLELTCAAVEAGRRGSHRRMRNLPSSDGDTEDDTAVAVKSSEIIKSTLYSFF